MPVELDAYFRIQVLSSHGFQFFPSWDIEIARVKRPAPWNRYS